MSSVLLECIQKLYVRSGQGEDQSVLNTHSSFSILEGAKCDEKRIPEGVLILVRLVSFSHLVPSDS